MALCIAGDGGETWHSSIYSRRKDRGMTGAPGRRVGWSRGRGGGQEHSGVYSSRKRWVDSSIAAGRDGLARLYQQGEMG